MLSFPPTVKAFACRTPIDLRKSFDGLSGCVERLIGADPLSGHLFVFFNKRATMVKILLWDRTGFCIWCKRLERGRFSLASVGADGACMELTHLLLLLEGIDISAARRAKRFRLPSAA
jgi:transposase